MNTQLKKRLFIIEDDAELRTGYEFIIKATDKFILLESFGSCEEAIPQISKLKPDIILLDIELPGINGTEGVKIIKEKFPYIEIIIISVYEDPGLVFEALKSGASGYITKSSNFQELIIALDEIAKGGAPMSTKIARMVIDNMHISHNSPLTRRETEVLQLISEGKTYVQISEILFISRLTAKTHIKNIYYKLQVNNKSDALTKANKEKLI